MRPITQARFRALNQAAEQADILRDEMQSLESSRQEVLAAQSAAAEAASRTAARNKALAANLEQATSTIEHLSRVEAAHVKAANEVTRAAGLASRYPGHSKLLCRRKG